MTLVDLLHRPLPLRALRRRLRAARVEPAAGRRGDEARDLSFQMNVLISLPGVRYGDRRKKSLGVRMDRVLEQVLGVRVFDDLSCVHDRDAIADELDDAEIMGDEEIREMELLLQILQEVQDLRLHGHVKRRGRLVKHDEIRVERKRPCDPDALLLPAAELMREPIQMLLVKPDGLEQLQDFLRHRLAFEPLVDLERLAEDLFDRHSRVERR